jgi:WD40 repeat protein
VFDANVGKSLSSLELSRDGQLLAVVGESSIRILDVNTGRTLQVLHIGKAESISLSPDKSVLAVLPSRKNGINSVQLWDVRSGKLLRSQEVSAGSVKFTRDGKSLLLDGGKRLDSESLGQIAKIGSYLWAWVVPSSRSDRGEVIIGSSFVLNVVDGTARPVFENQTEFPSWVYVVSSRDGKRLVGKDNYTAALFERSMGNPVRKLPTKVIEFDLSPDGAFVVGTNDRSVGLVDATDGRLKKSIVVKPGDDPQAVAFSPDGKTVVISLSRGGAIVWNIATGEQSRSIFDSDLEKVVFFPDGKSFLAQPRRPRGSVELWSVDGLHLIKRISVLDNLISDISVSSGGDLALVGGFDGLVRLVDVRSGNVRQVYQGLAGVVYTMDFALEGRRVVASDRDSINVWNTETGELLSTSLISEDGEWVTITPEGFFDASPGGSKLLSVVRGLEATSVDQFYDALHRPDLVREKLKGDPQGKVRGAAAKLDLNKVVASGSAPRVQVTAPERSISVTESEVTVHATITNQGGGIGKVEWRVNGTTLGVEQPATGAAESGRTISVERKLSLEPGENRIAVLAYNDQGLIASDPAEVVVTLEGQAARTPPRLHVLTVGVNDYWDSRLHLGFAAPDAKALGDALRKAGENLYERVDVTEALDAEATAAGLDRRFSELSQKVRPQDVFVFFLSGHGKTVDGRFYFIPQDFRYTGEDSIRTKGIGQDQLQQWLARIPARKSVLLFDACESGSLTEDRVATRGMEELTAIDRLTHAMGRTVLTATTDDKPAAEGVGGHGVFTYALLEGLGEAQTDPDGLIGVTELASFVDRKVPELSYEAFKIRQVPQMKIVGSNFPIARKLALQIEGTAKPEPEIPIKPTHVLIAPTAVHADAADVAPVVLQLQPGTQVRLVQTAAGGWALIARDGKKVGYVEDKALLTLQ